MLKIYNASNCSTAAHLYPSPSKYRRRNTNVVALKQRFKPLNVNVCIRPLCKRIAEVNFSRLTTVHRGDTCSGWFIRNFQQEKVVKRATRRARQIALLKQYVKFDCVWPSILV